MLDFEVCSLRRRLPDLSTFNAPSSICVGFQIGRMTGTRATIEALLGHSVQRTLGCPQGRNPSVLTPGKEEPSCLRALRVFPVFAGEMYHSLIETSDTDGCPSGQVVLGLTMFDNIGVLDAESSCKAGNPGEFAKPWKTEKDSESPTKIATTASDCLKHTSRSK